MDTIYRNARRVLILLENLDIESDTEQSVKTLIGIPHESENVTSEGMYISQAANTGETAEPFTDRTEARALDFLIRVFDDCRWFKRAWCCQEYQLNAERTFILVGHEYDGISLPSQFFVSLEDIFVKAFGDDHELYSYPTFLSELSCSYYEDIISIALNASGLLLSFNKNITSLSHCQFVLALILLSTGNASVLESIGLLPYELPTTSHQGALYWHVGEDCQPMDSRNLARLSSNSTISHICPESLTLDLFFLDSPLTRPTKDSIDVATARPRVSVVYTRALSKWGKLEVETLAAGLDIGIARTTQIIRNNINEISVYRKLLGRRSLDMTIDPITTAEDLMFIKLRNLNKVGETTPLVIHLNDEGSHLRYCLYLLG
ncbi:hypothetical protein NX059_007006 [Plenodomus lindquistii]|nr:hypothetical protein NX059_007006 [Plenodomus lindquistii]